MKRIPVVPSAKPIVIGVPPVLDRLSYSLRHLIFPKRILSAQKYLAIEVLPAPLIDSAECHAVAGDSLILSGFLMSSLFPIWIRGTSGRNEGMINYKKAYNTFPFPNVSKKEEEEILSRVTAVLRARGTVTGKKLSDIYCSGSIPDHIEMAHEDLDEVILKTFNLPADATNEQILEKLFSEYLRHYSK